MRTDIEGRIRRARVLGLTFVVVGFVVIGLGWAGAARKAFVDQQLPYLISGAAVGIGLILFGAALLVLSQMYDDRLATGRQIDRLTEILSQGGVPATGTAEAAVASADGLVVAGGSAYHRPQCRLVREKPDLALLTEDEAVSSGLSPCRVCHPEMAEASAGA